MRPMQSSKEVINLNDLLDDRIFNLPRSMANEIDLATGKPCLHIGINGNQTYLPVEEPTLIPYNVFCTLKDMGILEFYMKYDDGEELI